MTTRILIPHADKVFKMNPEAKKPTVMHQKAYIERWLEEDVRQAIINTRPVLDEQTLKIKGSVSVRVPQVWYQNGPLVKDVTKTTLEPLGYAVEFDNDGYNTHCLITWTMNPE